MAIGTPEAQRAQKKLAEEFLQIKFVAKQINRLVEDVRSLVEHAREQEKIIMDICVGKARLPRKTFIKLFPGNEANPRSSRKSRRPVSAMPMSSSVIWRRSPAPRTG